jgi:hypothetical protein
MSEFSGIATSLVGFSSSRAPQCLQTKAVSSFSFLQMGQSFPEAFILMTPKNKLDL